MQTEKGDIPPGTVTPLTTGVEDGPAVGHWHGRQRPASQPCTFVRARLSQSPNAQAHSEDVAREVLYHAYTGIIRFRSVALQETWLQSIAQYAIIDAARAARRAYRLSEGTKGAGPGV